MDYFWLFEVLCPIENFSLIWRRHHYQWVIPILKNHGEGSLACHIHCDTGHTFIMVIFKVPYHSHLLRLAVELSLSVLVTYVSRDLGSNSELPHTRRTLLIKEKYLSILIRCRVWAIVANYTCTSKCLKTTRDKHVLVTISVLPYMKYDVTYM